MSQFLSVIHKFSVLSSMQLFITEGSIMQSIHHMALLFRINSTTYCSDTFCIPPNHCCMYWVCHSASGLISYPDLKHPMKFIWRIVISPYYQDIVTHAAMQASIYPVWGAIAHSWESSKANLTASFVICALTIDASMRNMHSIFTVLFGPEPWGMLEYRS